MSNLNIKINNVTILDNDAITVTNKTEKFIKRLLCLKNICNEMLTDPESDITTIQIAVTKDIFPNHSTNITVVSGHEAYVLYINNATGSNMVEAASGILVSDLLSSISIDQGRGSAKVYTNSSKTTEANPSTQINSVMVIESKAQDNATITDYNLRLHPSDITTITIVNYSAVIAVLNTVPKSITVISGRTVTQVLADISVDEGQGIAKIFTDSSKTTEATGTATVTTTMVLESKAEDTVTIADYSIII